ncbi:MAG: 1,4-alpha-glucan branching protein GlgB [Cellulosilyticaceae bacterium]
MEKFKIISGESNRPHDYLGMHKSIIDNKTKLEVRVFAPGAVEVSIYPIKNKTKQYKLENIGDGIFQTILSRRKNEFVYEVTCKNADNDEWSYIDPYQFKQSFTDFELYLFGEGTDYEIYKKLGAHFVTHNGVEGVRFAVWAPNAKRVSVIGEFNFWDGLRGQMQCIEANGIWELFIPGIKIGELYQFEIKTQDNHILFKADPYAQYSELRPGRASRVWKRDTYEWQDEKWLQKRKEKQYHEEPVTIYEIHTGSWKKHLNGDDYTYRELADSLVEYITDMGYTHVELMGIMEHPFDGSWGYQVTGYFAPTSRYGTPDDFKYMIDKLHLNGIGVILDWVPAHFPKDAFALEKFDGTALYEHALSIQAEHPQWGTLIFNYGRNEVKLFLIASAISWIENYHIDGLRVDAVASMLYLDYGREDDNYVRNANGGRENLEAVEFIRNLNKVIYGKFEGVMMIAEESTSWAGVTDLVANNGLGFGFKWNMGWMNDILSYMKLDPLFRKDHHNKLIFSLMYAFSENFILPLSHDEIVHGKGSMLYKMPGDEWQKFANVRILYGYMFMHPGKKMIFMGNEIGQTREWTEEKEVDWYLLQYDLHNKLKNYMKDLNYFYKSYPALWELDGDGRGFEWIDWDNRNESIISFVRKSKNNKEELVVVVNFTPNVRQNFRIGVNQQGVYEEIFNSDDTKYGGSGVLNKPLETVEELCHDRPHYIEMTVPPLGINIFKLKQKK